MDGHLAVVTGAGSGLGRAVAVSLAREGVSVVLAARTLAALEESARLCAAASPPHSQALFPPVPTDVTEPDQVTALMCRVLAIGVPNSLVTCAGAASFQPLQEIAPEEWERILKVNLTGTFLCCRAVLGPMLERGSGQIVTVGSIASRVALPNSAAYTAAKWGVLGFTKALAEEVRRQGIRVTALLPGAVDTPLWEGSGGPPRERMLRPEHVAEVVVQIVRQPPEMVTDEVVVTPPGGIL